MLYFRSVCVINSDKYSLKLRLCVVTSFKANIVTLYFIIVICLPICVMLSYLPQEGKTRTQEEEEEEEEEDMEEEDTEAERKTEKTGKESNI